MKKNIIYLGILISLFACKKDDTSQIASELTENVKIISQASNTLLTQVDSSNLVFSGNTSQLDSVKVGTIMASSPTLLAPYGYLRRVLSLSKQGSNLIVQTTNATIEEAVVNGKLHVSRAITNLDIISEDTSGVELRSPSFNFYIKKDFDLDTNNSYTDDKVTIEGEVDIQPSFTFDIEVKSGKIEYFLTNFSFTNNSSLKVKYSKSLSFLSFHQTYVLKTFKLAPATFLVAGLPIVFDQRIVIVAGIDGSVKAKIEAEISNNYNANLGIEYKNGAWETISNQTNDFQFNPLTASVDGSLEGWIQPRYEIRPYGLSNARVFVAAKAALNGFANVNSNNPGVLNLGIKFKTKFLGKAQMEIFGASVINYEQEFYSNEIDLWSGNSSVQTPTVSFTENSSYPDYMYYTTTIEMNGNFYTVGGAIHADGIPNSWNYKIPIYCNGNEISTLPIQKKPGYSIVPELIGGNNRLFLIYPEPDANGNYGSNKKINEYNLNSSTWSAKQSTSLPIPHNGWVKGSDIFVFSNNGLYKYNTLSDTWTSIPSINSNFSVLGTISSDYLLCGNWNDSKPYKLNKNTFQLTGIGQEIEYSKIYTQQNEIFKFDENFVYKYNDLSNSWQQFVAHNTVLPSPIDYESIMRTFESGNTVLFYFDATGNVNNRSFDVIHN